MKTLPAVLTASLLAGSTLFALGQTAEPETTAPQVAPEAAPSEVPLIPETVPQTEKPGDQRNPDQKSKTEQLADALHDRIRFREAKTKALRDPKVQAEWERAKVVKTDLERRDALKTYYKLLYAKIAKLDASVKKLADERQTILLRRLEQTRLDPTQPLDPAGAGQ